MSAENGTLVGIYIAADKGEPMRSIWRVQAIPHVGLEGDRYALGRGAFSKAKPPKPRDVTLIGRETIAAANQAAGTDFTEAETRRNLVTEGVNLSRLVGRLFNVGDTLMFGVEPCEPCGRPSKLAGKPGFKEAFEDWGGLRAQIIVGGLLMLDDLIVSGNDALIGLSADGPDLPPTAA